jgi:hypothetical protein
MALGLYVVAVVTALTADSLARSAEMSGLSYDPTADRVMVFGCIVIASALLAWNVGEAVAYRDRR